MTNIKYKSDNCCLSECQISARVGLILLHTQRYKNVP